MSSTEQILGIKFFNGTVEEAVDVMSSNGGLLVVPAAPALVKLESDEGYRRALISADMAIADSGGLNRVRTSVCSGLCRARLRTSDPWRGSARSI
jgi:UDP-N-acetyl-D-mannosaminuronic acid transferase (WecB/TagA/CpsF family)